MLRVECSGCGKKVRGGDDWSGRSGNCPKCGTIIFFPHLDSEFDRAEIALRESGRSLASKVAEALEFPNLGRLKFIVVIGATGVSLWTWSYLIIVLAYGRIAYNMFGLRISRLTKHGIYLNNGDELNFFWNTIFMLGFFGLWYLLLEGANELVGRVKQKLLAWSFILLASGVTWYRVLHQDAYEARHIGLVTNDRFIRSYFSALTAIAIVAALTYWRAKRSREPV
jgi:hypothetical protein